MAIQQGVHSFKSDLKGKYVIWQTDDYAASIILHTGSNKTHLQKIAVDIFDTCKTNKILLKAKWVPREVNELADYLSKNYDYDDWSISAHIFNVIRR